MQIDRELIAILCVVAYGALPILIGVGAIRISSRNSRSRYLIVSSGAALLCGLLAAWSIFPNIEISKYPETDFIFAVVFVIWFVSIGATAGGLIDRFRFGTTRESNSRTT
jgi:hypothetical protein